MTKLKIMAAVGAGMIGMAVPAASATVYSGTGAAALVAATQFAAVLGVSTVQDFEAFADGDLAPSWNYGGSGTATLSNGFGVTSGYPYGGSAVSGSKGYGAYPNGGVGGVPGFVFTRPLRAFGAYFVDFEVRNQLVFNLLGGGTAVYDLPFGDNGNVAFFGVNFGTQVVTGVGFVLDPEDAFLIDDVRINAAVPEPGSWALLLAGFGVAGASLRWRRRTPTHLTSGGPQNA